MPARARTQASTHAFQYLRLTPHHHRHKFNVAVRTQHESRERSVYTPHVSHEGGQSPRSLTHHRQRHHARRPSRHQCLAHPAPRTPRRREADAASIWLRLHPAPELPLATSGHPYVVDHGRISVCPSRGLCTSDTPCWGPGAPVDDGHRSQSRCT